MDEEMKLEFRKQHIETYKNAVREYILNNTIPEAVAYYIKDSYYRNLLSTCPIMNHINSAIDVFNCRCDMNKLIPKVKEILKIKYNLVIKNINPLRLKRYY